MYTIVLLVVVVAVGGQLLWRRHAQHQEKRRIMNLPTFEREMYRHIDAQIAQPSSSSNLWIRALASKEMKSNAQGYASQVIEGAKELRTPTMTDVDAWVLWGATRMEENVLNVPDETLKSRVAVRSIDSDVETLMIARTAFEILIAEHALRHLHISDPRTHIATLVTKRSLERINALKNSPN